MLTLSHSARSALAALAAAAAVLPTTASAREIVSRVGGADSAPFAADLVANSSDGRFVVLRPAKSSSVPAADGEATVTSPTGLVIRDRAAQTVEPLTFTLPGPDGAPRTPTFDVRGFSNDGNRLFVTSDDPDFKQAVGEGGTPNYVSAGGIIERSTGTLLALPSYAGRPVMDYANAKLSADGASVIYTTQLDPNASGTATIVRGPVGGAAVPVLDLPDAFLWDASDDLQTFAYERIVPGLPRTDDPSRPNSGGLATRFIGVKSGDGAPHRVASDKYEEFLPTTASCTTSQISWRFDYTRPSFNMLSGDGSRVTYWTSHATSANPSDTGVDAALLLRSRTGERRVLSGPGQRVAALGRSHDLVALDAQTSYDQSVSFVDDDQTKLHRPGGERYVVADDVPLAGVPTTTGPLVFTAAEPVDTDTPGNVIFRSCPATPPTQPVGTLSQYATSLLTAPARAGRSLGTITFRAAPAGLRAAASIRVDVKPLLAPNWSASRTTDGSISLPAGRLLRPTLVRVTVQPTAESGKPRPAPLTSSTWVLPLR